MESDKIDDAEDLGPAEALASAESARETLVRRVKVPWAWDAFMATGLGVVLWLAADFPTMAAFVIVPWLIAAQWMKRVRQRRAGVLSDGSTSRTSDPLRWWAPAVVLVVVFTGLATRDTWAPALRVATVLAAAVLFVGLRWINRRAITRIRNAS